MDTSNRQMVGGKGNKVVVMLPKKEMTADEALIHAAWLVLIAEVYSSMTIDEAMQAITEEA